MSTIINTKLTNFKQFNEKYNYNFTERDFTEIEYKILNTIPPFNLKLFDKS
jgi:hypothetical protein